MDKTEMNSSVSIDAGSPWFSGHFPDDPILPGIAQLHMVADLVAQASEGNLRMTELSRIKFRKIVRPGELLDIKVSSVTAENNVTFRITSGGEDVCSGKMSFSQMIKEEHIHE